MPAKDGSRTLQADSGQNGIRSVHRAQVALPNHTRKAMDTSEEILKQLRWIKWLMALFALSFAAIAAALGSGKLRNVVDV